MIRKEIIKQYVSSLKEDGELDYIFPILLLRMGYSLLSTPKQSKGQSQYGRDVIAIKDNHLYLFELKGFRSKDITDRTLNEKDGIIESLRASKYTKYNDASLPELNNMHRRYVLVHNGCVESNALQTLNGFVEVEFPEGNFERWDLFKLTDLFSEFLFDETLLTDGESYGLFKRILVLLDSEGNDFKDVETLVNLQISKLKVGQVKKNERSHLNFFATIRLIGMMVYAYSKDANNLHPAKETIDIIVLKVWAWILKNKKEKSSKIIYHFNSLVLLQLKIYEEYLNKILPFAIENKGLCAFAPTDTEYIFYPLRCYNFLGDLVYFYEASEAYGGINEEKIRQRIELLKTVINSNSACAVPLLDIHSIPLQLVFRYVCLRGCTEDDASFLSEFLLSTAVNMVKRYKKTKMWPEMNGSRMALAQSIYEKSEEYQCDSSIFILILFELIAYANLPTLYKVLKENVEESGVNLQVSYPMTKDFDIEQCLFEHRLYNEISVQTNIRLPDTLEEFRETFKKPYKSIDYRTKKVNYGFLLLLAHKFYETDLFPDYIDRMFCCDLEN